MSGKSTLWVSLGYRQADHDTPKVAGEMCDDCNVSRALKDWCRTCLHRNVCERLKRIGLRGCWKQLLHPYKSLSTALYGSFLKFGDLQMDPKMCNIILIIRIPHSGRPGISKLIVAYFPTLGIPLEACVQLIHDPIYT